MSEKLKQDHYKVRSKIRKRTLSIYKEEEHRSIQKINS
jgi:hypothetical protein